MIGKILWIAAVCLVLTSPAQAEKAGKAEQAAIAATPEAVADAVAIQGFDDLDTEYVLSTQPFLPSKYGHDHFLRAYINKKTGSTSYLVYFWTAYAGEWKMLSAVNYETPDGPVSADVKSLDRAVLGCDRFGCSKREDMTFDVSESVLRSVSAGATAGTGLSWRYKVSGKYGSEPPMEMLRTEIAGLLLKVDALKRAQHIPSPTAK